MTTLKVQSKHCDTFTEKALSALSHGIVFFDIEVTIKVSAGSGSDPGISFQC